LAAAPSLNECSGTPAMTEVEPVVEPDCVTNDIGRESVAFVCIHLPILSILESLLGNTLFILVPHRFDLIAAYGFITVFKLRENIPNLMIRKLPLNFFLNPPLCGTKMKAAQKTHWQL
jgi:hypothetical protein